MSNQDCLFCKITAGEVPSNIVYEDNDIIAINDINPSAPVHILIIPRKHIASLNELGQEDLALMGHIQIIASRLAREFGIAEKGYRLVNNCGKWGGQDVLHLHYHLLGGRELGWPPG